MISSFSPPLLVAVMSGLAACGAGRNTIEGIEHTSTNALPMTHSSVGDSVSAEGVGRPVAGPVELQTATFALG